MDRSILEMSKLGFQWETDDPFLFCVHHEDRYPKGGENFGPPEENLQGRNLGNDFELKDGWRMYHGKTVPGFPAHPHRGLETVTIVLDGFIDHSDSHGSAGRYGNGDVQWMTAGSGLQHAEMMPLLNNDRENLVHLFQVWLNLPAKDKFAPPRYKMLWAENIPVIEKVDAEGLKSRVRLIAGRFDGMEAIAPPPSSWANEPDNRVNMWLVTLEPGASFSLPAVNGTVKRNIYFYDGDSLTVNGETVQVQQRVKLRGDLDITLKNGKSPSTFLLLEGEPINEAVFQYGPFVMNTKEEILEAGRDFRETAFGGWPWDREDPVHSGEKVRFARYADGRREDPGQDGKA